MKVTRIRIYHYLSLPLQVPHVGLPHTKFGQNYTSFSRIKVCNTTRGFIISSTKSILTFKCLCKIRYLLVRILTIIQYTVVTDKDDS